MSKMCPFDSYGGVLKIIFMVNSVNSKSSEDSESSAISIFDFLGKTAKNVSRGLLAVVRSGGDFVTGISESFS